MVNDSLCCSLQALTREGGEERFSGTGRVGREGKIPVQAALHHLFRDRDNEAEIPKVLL